MTLFQRILSSGLVTGLGMFFAKYAPSPVGRAVAAAIAGVINRFRPAIYWIVYANMRQMMGAQVDEKTLHRMVRRIFRNNARNNYELWHLVGRGREALVAAARVPDDVWDTIDRAREHGKGALVVGVHTGNFDVGLLALATQKLDMQILGIAEAPGAGFDLMDHMRTSHGLHLTSISVPALREAIRRLRAGGIVVTGIDRPVGDEEQWTEFFGRPAPLPTGHVRLALKTGASILVASTRRDARGVNVVRVSPPLPMVRTGDADQDLRVNMRRVTAWLEKFIRELPEQWSMFVPVWPEPND